MIQIGSGQALQASQLQEPFESLRSPPPSALFEDGGTDAFAILDTITIIR